MKKQKAGDVKILGDNESPKFWLGVLTELKNIGVQEILIFSVDGVSSHCLPNIQHILKISVMPFRI